MHAAHWRSAVAEPAADIPKPTAHVRHVAHAPLPADALNWPSAQLVHVRSLESVAALFMYSPAAHSPRMAAHAAPLSSAENVAPSSHAAHWRSAVSEPATDMPSPAAHVFHATQAWLPAVALNVPLAHVAHSRSDEAPGALVSYLPAAHTVMSAQVRSAVPEGAAEVYWPEGQAALCVLHTRSELSVGIAVSNSPPVHCVTAAHASPLLDAENVTPSSHDAHCRSAVAEPATDMPEPAAHVRHAAHAARPAELVKVPAAQSAHVRSADAVAAVLVCWPAAHGLRTAAHAAPLSSFEYVEPKAQAAHWRSAVAEPAADMPWPTAHAAH